MNNRALLQDVWTNFSWGGWRMDSEALLLVFLKLNYSFCFVFPSAVSQNSPPLLNSSTSMLSSSLISIPSAQTLEMPQPRPFRLESLDFPSPSAKTKRKKSRNNLNGDPLWLMEQLSDCCSLWPITRSPSLASCWWPLLRFQEPKAFLSHLGRVKAIKSCFPKSIRLISPPCSIWGWHLISQPIPSLFCTHVPMLPLQIIALPSNRKGNSPRRHGVKVPGHKLLSSSTHHLLHFRWKSLEAARWPNPSLAYLLILILILLSFWNSWEEWERTDKLLAQLQWKAEKWEKASWVNWELSLKDGWNQNCLVQVVGEEWVVIITPNRAIVIARQNISALLI